MTASKRKVLGLGAVVGLAVLIGIAGFTATEESATSADIARELHVLPKGPQSEQMAIWVAEVKTRSRKLPFLSGIASWYGEVLDGHTTASGEVFDKDALTACHRTLPFGTLVRVINLRTRKSVVVKINDRGILYPDRVIDLSSAAAEQLGMLRTGVAPVKLEIVGHVSKNGAAPDKTARLVPASLSFQREPEFLTSTN